MLVCQGNNSRKNHTIQLHLISSSARFTRLFAHSRERIKHLYISHVVRHVYINYYQQSCDLVFTEREITAPHIKEIYYYETTKDRNRIF